MIRATDSKQTAKPSGSLPGYVMIQEGDETIFSFWSWAATTVSRNEETGHTSVSFPKMWLSTSASVDAVTAAMGAAMLLWNQAKDQKKKRRAAPKRRSA